MKNPIARLKKKISAFRIQHISIYCRDGKYYWTIKSCGFDSFEEAVVDASFFCHVDNEDLVK